ncbi:MAG: hypothetical protein RhofKO_13090 [Rhodothermales bacterium]
MPTDMLGRDASFWLMTAHIASTFIMLGVILIVQVVHYPLFAKVGEATYVAYQADHMRLITYIVFPAMLVELLTAIALVFTPPIGVPTWLCWVGLALVAVIWASTALLQVPIHSMLTAGFDATAHQRLVATNWIRTMAWLLRGGLVAWMLVLVLRTLAR